MRKRLFPVLHLSDLDTAIRNTQLVSDSGADGIFYIHHRKNYKVLLNLVAPLRIQFPNLWMGLNFLDLNTPDAIRICPKWANGLWVDDGGVFENSYDELESRAHLYWDEKTNHFIGEYFASFAFKYQKRILNLEEGTAVISQYADVITTSGNRTGIAADKEKIKRIAKAKDSRKRLAIASGITPHNIEDYLSYVDDFLVATGISTDEHNFDERKLRLLVHKIHSSRNEI